MADVPQELVDLVVDSIDDDRRSLINASLVCRSWCLATRPHLFRRANFNIGFRNVSPPSDRYASDDHSFHRFHLLDEIVQERPSIAYNIREVEISGAIGHDSSLWPRAEPLITSILSRLRRVNYFYLREIQWKFLSVQCKQALVSIFSSPSLQSVRLHCFSAPLPTIFSLLGMAKNLKSLCSASTPVGGAEYGHASFEPTAPVELRSLELGTCNNFEDFVGFLLDPECPVDISQLQNLRMTNVTDVPSCGQLLRAAGKTLETLELWAPTTREPKRVGDNISFNWLPALRSFQIRGLLFSPTVCSIPCLCDIFSVKAPHDIEEIHLLVDTDNRRGSALDWGSWTQLDIIFSSSLFRSLISVDITLYFTNPNGQIFLNSAALRRSMPRLLKRGILTIHSQY